MRAGKMSSTAGLLEQSNQLGLFGKEGVMAVGAGHLTVVRSHAGGTEGMSKLTYRFRREEPVGTDAHKAEPGLDASEHLLSRRMAVQRIPRFHGSQNGEVGVGVETLDKALAAQPPLETRQRLEELRGKMTGMLLQGERLRAFRAVEVLDRIGTPEARELLRTLADGAPEALLTTSARAALKR